MEYSRKCFRYPEERRLTSRKFVELHVLFVPNEQWNLKLNRVPVEAIESFISTGFIRVFPDTSLRTLRSELGILLGAERDIDKFSFLKCVGRSLALVKAKQERDLKVKYFAPPYAPQPELYLLPRVEIDNSVCSQSLTPNTHSTDPQTYYTARVQGMPTGTKEPFKFPQIPQGLQPQPPPSPSPDEEAGEEESYSSTEENEEDLLSSQKPGCAEDDHLLWKAQAQGPPQCVIEAKESVVGKVAPAKKKQRFKRNRASDSGVPESLEDKDYVFSPTPHRKSIDAQTLKYIRNKQKNEVPEHPVTMPTQYASPPPAPTLGTRKTAASVFLSSRDELIEEIKMAKEERKQLEQTRQELLRKGKDLLAQNRHRRNQARDSWKRSYFDTKKATAPLEVTLRSLRQELEIFYNNILHQLKARDGGGKPRWRGRLSSTKNELIIQIMTESHEIDNLRKKVDDAKMRLVTEIKLGKQAATELRALKAELAQKNTQTFLSGSMGFGAGARDRPQAHSIPN
ncbi:spermatogenesis-associated protein 1 isoform X2 [Salvelinus namaycush]|uniref:Spermatogenesis-associated protein 1 isoform X2 n=1 Tax=Salvelinus namaycush TaxID=8040 RepID=A0A8U1BRE4_SALNM|nr:spermatogenesis-associated protein 1 isoform X2 [Salvelinus namaycush]